MAYEVSKVGNKYAVVDIHTKESISVYPTKREADAALAELQAENPGRPDKVGYLSDGTPVNITYTNKEKYSGKTQ